MKLYIVENYNELSKKAADILTSEINENKNLTLGLATGSTPEGMYAELVKNYEAGNIDFKDVTTFNLDEYYGLEKTHEQSYYYFMEKHLLSKVNVKKKNINIPDGMTDNVEKEASDYDKKIEDHGGIDLQVLGIGVNGHIGFNEPGDVFIGETHLVDLTPETLDANARFFSSFEEVPKEAITMGMKSIFNAKKILLLASGENKADALKMTLEGPITPEVPASLLQLHENLIVIVDKKAGSKLNK